MSSLPLISLLVDPHVGVLVQAIAIHWVWKQIHPILACLAIFGDALWAGACDSLVIDYQSSSMPRVTRCIIIPTCIDYVHSLGWCMVAAVALQSSVNCLRRQGREECCELSKYILSRNRSQVSELWSGVGIYLIACLSNSSQPSKKSNKKVRLLKSSLWTLLQKSKSGTLLREPRNVSTFMIQLIILINWWSPTMINLPSPCCHLKVKPQGFLLMRLGEGDEGVWEVSVLWGNATGWRS
jgi:hypothetical protein